jgi:predicted TIM-barrel fold metal-dependent hydrolase
VDFSEINAFISQSVVHCLRELLEMTPVTKILYGSDSYGVPDIFWFSALHFKKSLEKVLKDFIHDSILSPEYAQFAADRILRENAWEFYKLGNFPDQ